MKKEKKNGIIVTPSIIFAFSRVGNEFRIEAPKTRAVLIREPGTNMKYILSDSIVFDGISAGIDLYRRSELDTTYGRFQYSWGIEIMRNRIKNDEEDWFGVADFRSNNFAIVRMLVTPEESYISKNAFSYFSSYEETMEFARKLRDKVSLFDF